MPKFSSIPTFGIFGSSGGKNEDAVSTTTTIGVTELIGLFQDHTGSGEGSNSEESQQTTTLTQGHFMSVTKIRTEPPPTGTSDLLYSGIAQSNTETFVSPTSSHIRNTQFTDSPHRSNTPEQNTTHMLTPWRSTSAETSSTGATENPLPSSVYRETIFHTERISSTIPPETTVPTALTWKTVQTTTPNPGLVETIQTSTHLLGHDTLPAISESNFVGEQEDLSVSVALHSVKETSEIHSTQSNWNLGLSEISLVNTEQQPGVTSTYLKTGPTMVEGTTSDINPTQNPLDFSFSETSTVNFEQHSEVFSAALKTDHNLEVVRTTSELYHIQNYLDLGFSETTMMNDKQEPGVFSSTLRKDSNLVVATTKAEIQTTQSHLNLGFSKTSMVNAEQQPQVFSTTLWIDRNLAVESIPSTTQSQRANFPIVEGKQT